MGGFDYGGGPGDGTSWSKERGETPEPGGGMPSSGGGSSQGSGSNSAASTMVSSGVPSTFSLTEGFLAFGIGAAALSELASTPLAAVASSILSRAFAPLAAVWPSSIAPDDMSVIGAGVKQQHIAQVMSAKDIVTVDLNALFSQPEASVKARVNDVIDNGKQVLAVARDKGTPTKAPVVQAKPTGKPRQFDVSVPGLSTPLRLDVAQPSAVQPNSELDSKTFAKVTDQSAKPLSARMQGGNTRDAIVTFPKELNMDPVYISVTRLLSEVELRQREESQAQEELNQRRAIREQAEQIVTWNWAGGVAEVTQYERRKVAAEARLAERQQLLAVTQARVERLDAQARSARAVAGLLGNHHNQERMDANARAAAFEKAASEGRMQIDGLWREIGTLSEQLKSATAELAQKIEATAKAEAEAKAAAEARAKAEAEARAKLAALMAKAGVNPTPVYTSEMVKSAQASLTAAGALVLNRASGMTQLSTFAEGILTAGRELSGAISGAISRGAVAVVEAAPTITVGTVATTVGTLVIGFWPGEAGESQSEIDKTIGRDRATMLGVQASLMAAGKVNIQPEMTSVNLPVRGFITVENGRQYAALVKTGVNGVSANVPVLRAVRDEKTGLDKITLPAVGGVPTRTVLINPVPTGPAAPPHTGNSSPVPVTPVHTGTEIKQVASIVTTTYPADDLKDIRDFIYWQPDAAGTGVEPIYVMLSGPYGETNAKGEYSGRDYNTDKAGGPIQNLDWKGAKIDRAGVDKVKLHAGRFGESPENKVMIDRLEKILKGELAVTDTDKRFYTHEIRELERYRNLGIKDGEVPKNDSEVWNNTHTATLEDYKLSSDENLLYTPEALNSQK